MLRYDSASIIREVAATNFSNTFTTILSSNSTRVTDLLVYKFKHYLMVLEIKKQYFCFLLTQLGNIIGNFSEAKVKFGLSAGVTGHDFNFQRTLHGFRFPELMVRRCSNAEDDQYSHRRRTIIAVQTNIQYIFPTTHL